MAEKLNPKPATAKAATTTTTTSKQSTKTMVYSAPVSAETKTFVMNESNRTGLTQKELIDKAIAALKAGPKIPNAAPVQLKEKAAKV